MSVVNRALLATALLLAQLHAGATEPAPAQGIPPVENAHTTVPDPHPTTFAPTCALIHSWIAKGYYTGASLLVVRDGRPLLDIRFGDHTDATVEYIASAGKWLAAATIMALVDQGRLRLDEPVGGVLPELGPELGRASLRQLLAHTSGYPAYQPEGRHRDDYQLLAESVAQLASLAPLAEPGRRWVYGGLAMQAAGRMAEVATGETWEALFQRLIAAPLGMVETHFTPVDGGVGHSPMLGGGARSCVRDYARFLAMLLAGGVAADGRRVLSEAAVAELQADQVGTAEVPADNFVWRVRGTTQRGIYGLGEWREIVDGGRAVVVSSPSWAGTYPWIDHRRHLSGFFLAHVRGEAAGRDGFDPMRQSARLVGMVAEVVGATATAGDGKDVGVGK
jgi:CubicO group peptidase (beta-lactamase class C family)